MLETEIKNLTAAIRELSAVMTGASDEMKKDAAVIIEQSIEAIVIPEPVVEPIPESVPETVQQSTHSDLRAVILAANRANPDNKAIIKALMTELGAGKVTEVEQDKIYNLINDIKAAIK